jgi:alpha-amylase
MSARSVADDWRDQVIYQIFVDRFAGYDPNVDPMEPQFVGGKIAGITKNLEYVKELGATCIYLTPFLKGASYHGYHVTDLFEVDPRFGALSDIQELADRIHALDMRLMIDLVPNTALSNTLTSKTRNAAAAALTATGSPLRNGLTHICRSST